MAANPAPYVIAPGASTIKAPLPPVVTRQYSFTANSINNPTSQQPGDRMDAEYDRTNGAVNTLTTFCSATFNTDGSLKPGSVGEAQLDPSIADDISNDIYSQVQPLVDQAGNYASSALASATNAAGSEAAVADDANLAQGAAAAASTSATQANTSAVASNQSATAAANSATIAGNYANDADEDAALCEDYGLVTQAWAEHMPDPIPPNILAIMNITGDHWSSRWWANHAAEVVSTAQEDLDQLGQQWEDTLNEVGSGYEQSLQDQYENYLQQFQTLYLGAFYSAPVADSLGNPIAQGALYYNLTLQAPYVWNGNKWVNFITPGPADINRYIYVSTAGQTLYQGPDRYGNSLELDAQDLERSQVFHKGILLTPTDDYLEGVNQITLHAPSTVGDIVQIFVTTVPQVTLDWNTVKIDTSGWTTTGGTLKDTLGNPVLPATSTDVFVSVNGVWQEANAAYTVSSSSIAFNTPIEADARTFAIAIVPTEPAQVPGSAVTKIDTSGWVFDGVATTFTLVDQNSNPVNSQAVNLLISLNGIWQNATVDYTVNASAATVTFTTPPEHDAQVFAVSGLPSFTATT